MKLHRSTSTRLALAAVLGIASQGSCLGAMVALGPTWSVNDYNTTGKHVTLTGQSASGYSYTGSGTEGLPGTTLPDSRRRPKVYQDFTSFDASGVGSTLSLTYDILWGGAVDPTNSSQNWRFGFIGSAANGGKGTSLGANFDLGNLAGTVAYEFFVDSSVTSGEAGSGAMDSAFTDTLNGAGDGVSRFAQSNADPFADDVSFNDRTDTHRVTLTLERIASGYDLSLSWQNLVSGNTITHATTITTSDADPYVALAAGITAWDRLGFFINSDVVSNQDPWIYTLSNVEVNAMAVPEPASALVAVCLGALVGVGLRSRRRRRSSAG